MFFIWVVKWFWIILFFTYPPLVAGRYPDGKGAPNPKTLSFSKGFMASDPKNHWESIWLWPFASVESYIFSPSAVNLE